MTSTAPSTTIPRLGGRPKGFTKETIRKLLVIRTSYNNPEQTPEDIYEPLNISRATYYRYVKILDNHTNEEIKKMKVDKK